jgi:hypothetical protein
MLMQTTGIREGDIIEYNVRGQVGHALVSMEAHVDPVTKKRVVGIVPLGVRDNLPTRRVTSYQIKNHWRKRRLKGKANGNGNGESAD